MGLITSLRDWIDGDWERRSYVATFASTQKLFWISPFLVIGGIAWLIGAEAGDLIYDWGLPVSLALCLVPIAYSFYRWFRGYSRTSWQDKQARKRGD